MKNMDLIYFECIEKKCRITAKYWDQSWNLANVELQLSTGADLVIYNL